MQHLLFLSSTGLKQRSNNQMPNSVDTTEFFGSAVVQLYYTTQLKQNMLTPRQTLLQ
jgi:uncharacterized MAPEG superfamily protein